VNTPFSCGHDHGHDHDHDHDLECRLPENDSRDLSGSGELESVYYATGLQFRHPAGWVVHEEPGDAFQTVTVQTPGTCFWQVSLFGPQSAGAVLESVLEAFSETYEELDIYDSETVLCGFPALVREIDFVCMDLLSAATLIAFQTPAATVLILFQGEDRELDAVRPQLLAMSHSLKLEDALGLSESGRLELP